MNKLVRKTGKRLLGFIMATRLLFFIATALFVPAVPAQQATATLGVRDAHDLLQFNHSARAAASAAAVSQRRDARMEFSFKVDPRLTRGLYMGDRWISPSIYVGAKGQDMVEARVVARDARGNPMAELPRWIPADPSMVTVAPTVGSEVHITVNRAGESRVQVVAGGITEELIVKAMRSGEVIKLQIHRGS